MSSELQQQKALAELLEFEYKQLGIDAKIYSGNEFKRLDTHWAKKPDLIITNVPNIIHKKLNNQISMSPPIGIEYKKRLGTTQFIRAVKLQAQDKYLKGKYKLKETNKKIKLNTISFSNEDFIKNGHYSSLIDIKEGTEPFKYYQGKRCISEIIFIEDMWAERVCWAFDMPLLLRRQNNFIWSYRNYFFSLDGKEVARYGKNSEYIEY